MTLDTSAGDARMEAAEAKRARKAAKRRRDAELTRLGRAHARNAIVWTDSRDPWWRSLSCHPWSAIAFCSAEYRVRGRRMRRDMYAGNAWYRMCAIRRGEVQP